MCMLHNSISPTTSTVYSHGVIQIYMDNTYSVYTGILQSHAVYYMYIHVHTCSCSSTGLLSTRSFGIRTGDSE